MLSDKDAAANIAVKNLETARQFYEDMLGRTQIGAEDQELIVFRSGNSTINFYQSHYAGTNSATAVTWVVGENVEDVMQALKVKGVTFEHYKMPDTTREGNVYIDGNMKIAWFKDTDDNILNIVSKSGASHSSYSSPLNPAQAKK
jgi:catechol 2,3-dioxygenase-like lactoylglutathione lyase family enzyme